jgi:hypothetical protein
MGSPTAESGKMPDFRLRGQLQRISLKRDVRPKFSRFINGNIWNFQTSHLISATASPDGVAICHARKRSTV